MKRTVFTIDDTSPAAAGQAKGDEIGGLHAFDWFTVDAALVGATGGTLQVYLQRKVLDDDTIWADWLHFPSLADGAAAVKYAVGGGGSTTINVVGHTADDGTTGAPALAVNTFVGGHPGTALRPVYVAGVGTSAGAAVKIYITAWKAGS